MSGQFVQPGKPGQDFAGKHRELAPAVAALPQRPERSHICLFAADPHPGEAAFQAHARRTPAFKGGFEFGDQIAFKTGATQANDERWGHDQVLQTMAGENSGCATSAGA